MCHFPSLKAKDFVAHESLRGKTGSQGNFPHLNPSFSGTFVFVRRWHLSNTAHQQAKGHLSAAWVFTLVPSDGKDHFLETWGLAISSPVKCSECASHGCLVTGLCLAMERQLNPGTVECGLIIYSGWPSPSCTLAVGLMLNPDSFFFFSLSPCW